MNAFLTPDPDLLQLAVAADAGAMHSLIAAHFPWLGAVAACQLARIRYRRGERAILQYSVGHSWVTALAYPRAELPRIWRKVQRQLRAMPHLATQVVKLDDLGLVLQCFPFDWNLPTLSADSNHAD
ncbi:MAG: hypothetical protein HC853_17305 [Anaerolineae bacterium]|nr:hypothetical protein [Anaerolineae bacterium]